MKFLFVFILAASPCVFAQDSPKPDVVFQSGGPGVMALAAGKIPAPVEDAPYSATITNEFVQTLADGNRIVQTTTGNTARDSQGRTRQDASLPMIGNLSAANAPHLVFIQDPVSQTSYTLNLTDKTAQKISMPSFGGPGPMTAGSTVSTGMFFVQTGGAATMSAPPPPLPPPPGISIQRSVMLNDQGQATTEDLGSQTIEGVLATGVRTTRTIPAGQIGNDKAINIVTEVWTSPDLKTIVYSKRSDPRMGEQTFQLTNIVRANPDHSLFDVPADFKIVDGPQPILYRSTQ